MFTKTNKVQYIAGWNTPGCLPDSAEELPRFDTREDAVAYLVENVDRFWDEDYEMGFQDVKLLADEKWLPVHTALHVGLPLTTVTADGSLVFWIEQVSE